MTAGDDSQSRTPNLSEPIEVFKPMMGNIVAGFIFGVILVVGGVSAVVFPLRAAYLAGWNLPLEVKTGWCWLAVGLLCFVGLALLTCGVVLFSYSRGLIGHRVELYADGFRFYSGPSADEVPWARVRLIRETILYERLPILTGPAKLLLPEITSTSYLVVTAAGKEYEFNAGSVKLIKRFGKRLRAQADRLSLRWETVEQHG